MKLKFLIIPALLLISCSSDMIPSNVLSSLSSIFNSTSFSSTLINNTSNIPSSDNSTINSTIVPKEKIKIYLNPSVQVNNIYYNKITTEAEMMNKVSDKIYQELSKDSRFEVYHNDRYLSLKDSVKESNSLNVDYHLALHTNAGGGSGSECYYANNQNFAKQVLTTFNKYHSFKNRGVKNGNHLYEIKNSTAKNKALIEFLFHDNKTESEFIIENYDILALSIVEAFYDIAK